MGSELRIRGEEREVRFIETVFNPNFHVYGQISTHMIYIGTKGDLKHTSCDSGACEVRKTTQNVESQKIMFNYAQRAI